MASGHNSIVLRHVHRLFGAGTVAGLGEGALLDRFVSDRDEVAFAAIVARHGPMVLGVCRRLLRDPHDVEDAFQATFLVLVRKAGSLRDRAALGPWLYGVASRVAIRARSKAERRRGRERTDLDVSAMAGENGRDGVDLRAVLDEEINRLPEKLRGPIILCHLEGRTQEEAAQELRWTPGMVRGRLARGRERLRARLTRRGLAPSAGLAGFWIGSEAGAAIPEALAEATVRAGTLGGVSPSVATLTEGVRRALFLTRLKSIAAGLLALGSIVLAASAGRSPIEGQARAVGQEDPPRAPAQATARAVEVPRKDAPTPARRSRGRFEPTIQTMTVVGEARDQEGRPVAGATIVVTDANGRRAGGSPLVLRQTTTLPTGRFILDMVPLPVWTPDPGPIPKPTEGKFEVAGWAPGYGFTWDEVRSFRPDEVDPTKAKDPVFNVKLAFGPPARLHGKMTDDRGKPIAGAKVQVGLIDDPRRPDGGGTWRCDALDPNGGEPRPFNGVAALPESLRSTKTDQNGEYHIDGLPRDARLLTLLDADPACQPESLTIATTDRPIQGARSLGYDGTLDHTFETPRKVGVVLHSNLPGSRPTGLTIRAQGDRIQRAGAMARLRNEFLRLPPGSYTLTAEPGIGSKWLPVEKKIVVENTDLQIVDINIEAGAEVSLEVIDAETGDGVAGVGFAYVTDTTRDRQEVQSSPAFVDHPRTDAEGVLSAVMAPGPKQFFITTFPDSYEPKETQSKLIALEVGLKNRVRFKLQPKPKKTTKPANDLSGPDGELRKRLHALWRRQQETTRRAYFVARRSWQPAEGIALDELRKLLDALDPDTTPKVAHRIKQWFPEAAPANETRLEVYVDEPKRREIMANLQGAERKPSVEVTVFNGKEEVRYNSSNAQVDIFGQPRIAITSLIDFAQWPFVSDNSDSQPSHHITSPTPKIRRDGKRVTIEWEYTHYTTRTVVDETTGFIYRDSFLQKDGLGQESWQFHPTTYPNGVTLPSLSVEVRSRKEGIDAIWIRSLDAVQFDAPIPPETFLVAVSAGTMILDYRDEDRAKAQGARNDAYRGVLRGPISDVVAHADQIAAKRKPPEPPRIKEGDQAPPLKPAVWLDQNGKAEPPALAGKVVLIDFWGITCGPCVAQLPEVREAFQHFARSELVIVGLHDSGGTVKEVAEFARKRQLTYPMAIDRPDEKSNGFGATFEDYGVRSIPSAAVLDRQGRVVFVGRFPEALARAAELLDSKKEPTKPTP